MAGQDVVAGGERTARDLELLGPKPPPGTHPRARAVVELGDVGPPVRDDQRLVARRITDRAPPVLNELRPGLLRIHPAPDAAVFDVRTRPRLHVAGAQRPQRISIPRLALTT